MKNISVYLFLVLFSVAIDQAKGQSEKPNILFIMADDIGAECLTAYGGQSYSTPTLDFLAANGAKFEHAYATPICAPSRVQLMTGKYPYQTGWSDNEPKEDPTAYLDAGKHSTVAQMLKAAGYRTGVAGKWQLCRFHHRPDHVTECGFDTYSVHTMWDTNNNRTSPYWNPEILENGKLREDTNLKFGADLFSDFLIDFMLQESEKPFFAYYPMYLAHDPFIRTPDNLGEYGHRDYHDNFGGMISYADKMIRKILNALEDNDLLENTIVIFTTDNGTNRRFTSEWKGKAIEGGKARLNEQGTRVPFMVYWKDMIQPKSIDALIDFTDLYPTLAVIAGHKKLPDDLSGQSFYDLLFSDSGKTREWVFSQYQEEWYVRNHEWLVRSNGQIENVSKAYNPVIFQGKESDPGLKKLLKTAEQFKEVVR